MQLNYYSLIFSTCYDIFTTRRFIYIQNNSHVFSKISERPLGDYFPFTLKYVSSMFLQNWFRLLYL